MSALRGPALKSSARSKKRVGTSASKRGEGPSWDEQNGGTGVGQPPNGAPAGLEGFADETRARRQPVRRAAPPTRGRSIPIDHLAGDGPCYRQSEDREVLPERSRFSSESTCIQEDPCGRRGRCVISRRQSTRRRSATPGRADDRKIEESLTRVPHPRGGERYSKPMTTSRPPSPVSAGSPIPTASSENAAPGGLDSVGGSRSVRGVALALPLAKFLDGVQSSETDWISGDRDHVPPVEARDQGGPHLVSYDGPMLVYARCLPAVRGVGARLGASSAKAGVRVAFSIF